MHLPPRDTRNISTDNPFRIENDGSYCKVRTPPNKLRSLQFINDINWIANITNGKNEGFNFIFLSEAAQSEILKELNKTQPENFSEKYTQKDLEELIPVLQE